MEGLHLEDKKGNGVCIQENGLALVTPKDRSTLVVTFEELCEAVTRHSERKCGKASTKVKVLEYEKIVTLFQKIKALLQKRKYLGEKAIDYIIECLEKEAFDIEMPDGDSE